MKLSKRSNETRFQETLHSLSQALDVKRPQGYSLLLDFEVLETAIKMFCAELQKCTSHERYINYCIVIPHYKFQDFKKGTEPETL